MAGIVTTHTSQDERPTVYDSNQSMSGFLTTQEDLVAPSPTCRTGQLSFEDATGIHSKLHAIGRLDADTTGLLLLTNDGSLVHHVTNPVASRQKMGHGTDENNFSSISKSYRALIMGHHADEPCNPSAMGLILEQNMEE